MTHHDSNDVPVIVGQPGTEQTSPGGQRWPGQTESNRGRALLVVGVILAFVSVGALVGGVAAMMAYQDRDSGGYYATDTEPFATDSYAMTSPPEFTGFGMDLPYVRNVLGTIRVSGENSAPATPLFIGIGPADDVAAYLADVAHDEVSEIKYSPFSAEYSAHPGGPPDEAPTAQTFWTSSVSGTGIQTLTAEVPPGEWSVVVMNADGSVGVETNLSVGATMPIIGWIAVSTLVIGGVMLIVAIILILFVRSRRHQ